MLLFIIRGGASSQGGGVWSGHPDFAHQSVWRKVSNKSSAKIADLTGRSFERSSDRISDYGAPNDWAWQEAAIRGTYIYVDDSFAKSTFSKTALTSFNIITVDNNYITQIIHLNRQDDESEYEISHVTDFKIEEKGWKSEDYKTWYGKTKTRFYQVIRVFETTTQYENGKATENIEKKRYRERVYK